MTEELEPNNSQQIEFATGSLNRDTLTTVARSLGGSAILGLVASTLLPEVGVVLGAAAVGLVGGYFAKVVDRT